MPVTRKLKERTCKLRGCDGKYLQYNSIVNWCSPACGAKLALERVAKKEAKAKLQRKRENYAAKKAFLENDKKHVEKQAKAYFHRWVKVRDQGLRCCACDGDMSKLNEVDKQASHYRPSKMNSAIRYHPDNVHLGCSHCNKHRSGNESEYRVHLINKIGIDCVEWLESQRQVKRWTIEELRQIRDRYGNELKAMGMKLPTVSH